MKVVLFIGHHKTGSSSLQEFLSQNSLALVRGGILYPAVETEGLVTTLKMAVRGGDRVENLPINLREAHNALAFRMIAEETGRPVPPFHTGLPRSRAMFRAIEQQIAAFEPEAVILASEVFSNFERAPKSLVGRLAALFRGTDIHVIATLRRIDDYLASWHGQRLRFGGRVASLRRAALGTYGESIHFDYRRMIAPWREWLPDARLTLRPYGDVMAAGGSVGDFMQQSGIVFPPDLMAAPKSNTGFHRGLAEAVRLANHRLAKRDADEFRRMATLLGPDLKLPPSREIEMFGAQTRLAIADAFEPVQAYLGEITGKAPFFVDQDAVRQTLNHDDREVSRDAAAQLLARKGDVRNAAIRDFLKGLEAGDDTPPAALQSGKKRAASAPRRPAKSVKNGR